MLGIAVSAIVSDHLDPVAGGHRTRSYQTYVNLRSQPTDISVRAAFIDELLAPDHNVTKQFAERRLSPSGLRTGYLPWCMVLECIPHLTLFFFSGPKSHRLCYHGGLSSLGFSTFPRLDR